MKENYSASEVVELGVEIEKNGYAFYTELAAQTKDKNAQEIFLYLAGEEKKHIEAFERILAKVESFEPEEAYPDEYFAYMHDLASEHVFTKVGKGKEVAKGISSETAAIDKALLFEKDSVRFFESMKQGLPQNQHAVIDSLVEQEKKHIAKLELLRSTY